MTNFIKNCDNTNDSVTSGVPDNAPNSQSIVTSIEMQEYD